MATSTTNYNLVKPDYNESADIEVINSNMDIIDEALNSLSNRISNTVSDYWNNSTIYEVGQYCIYDNKLWKCLVQHSGQTPTEGTYWTQTSIDKEFTELKSDLDDLLEVKNKNLLTSDFEEGFYTSSGEIVQNGDWKLEKEYISVLQNVEYSITNVSSVCICFYNENKEFVTWSNRGSNFENNICKFTSDYPYIRVTCVFANTNIPTIEDGSICSERLDNVKSTLENHEIILSQITEGKELICGNYVAGFISSTGDLINNDGWFRTNDYLKGNSIARYELSNISKLCIVKYDENKNFLSWSNRGSFSGNATFYIDSPYFKLTFKPLNDSENVTLYDDISYDVKSEKIDKLDSEIVKVFYVGANQKYTKLIDGIAEAIKYKNSILYVGAGTYDLLEEYGTDYVENFPTDGSNWGTKIENGLTIIFSPNSLVTCNYEGTSYGFRFWFSPFDIKGNCTIKGLNLECKNVKYGIHDDYGYCQEYNEHNYEDCNITVDNRNNTVWHNHHCIGGGFGTDTVINIRNCYFNSVGLADNGESVSYHNTALTNASVKSLLTISNCYFEYGTCAIKETGNHSAKHISKALVSGCRVKSLPFASERTDGGDAEVQMIQFNNVVE